MPTYRIYTTRHENYVYTINAECREDAIDQVDYGADGTWQGVCDETIDDVEIVGEENGS